MDPSDRQNAYRLMISEPLGAGSFGETFKCVQRRTNKVFAAKLVDANKLDTLMLRREIPILEDIRTVACANLIELVEYIPCEPRVWIVMEYCNNGNLEELLTKKFHWRIMKLTEMQHMFVQLARGMKVLQARGIIHRDLKLANVLLHDPNGSKGSDVMDLVVKITDFNLSIMLSEKGKLTTSTEAQGSFAYQAPECLNVPAEGYGPKVDLWSVGVMLFQCATKAPLCGMPFPYKGDAAERLLKEYNNGAVPDFPAWWLSPVRTSDLQRLIMRLLTINSDDRIGFEEFFSHPFVRDA